MSDPVEIGQGEQHLELVVVLFEASVARLLEAELTLDHPKGMFHFGPQVGFCRLQQRLKSSFRCVGQRTSLTWSHGDPELTRIVFELLALLNAEMT